MKKFALAAAAVAALATAAPVAAQEAPTADPFVSTQVVPSLLAGANGAFFVAGLFGIIAVAASSDTE